MMLRAELKVIGGKQSGNRIALPPKFLIGREQDCQLRPNSDLVSRHHCMFTLDDYTLRLRDLGSTNGTLVNNEPLDGQTVLKTGDNVRVGNLEFEVVILEENAPSPGGDQQHFVADHDSRIIPPGGGEIPTSETLVDVVLPHAIDEEAPTESFLEGANANGGDPNTIPAYPQPGWPAGMPPQGYYPPPPGYYPPQGMPYPPPGYPQYYPQQPGYVPQQAAPPASAQTQEIKIPEVRLPDPSETGVKDAEPGAQGKSGSEPNPSDKANELLNKMKTRR
jgi:FHA domain